MTTPRQLCGCFALSLPRRVTTNPRGANKSGVEIPLYHFDQDPAETSPRPTPAVSAHRSRPLSPTLQPDNQRQTRSEEDRTPENNEPDRSTGFGPGAGRC